MIARYHKISEPLLKRSLSVLAGTMLGSSASDKFPVSSRTYQPSNPAGPFPYSTQDLTPLEPGADASFYNTPRFVTHIDDNAIKSLSRYYSMVLPQRGRILDFCSSWISHYPSEVESASKDGVVTVLGTGMNRAELARNPLLKAWAVQDLNEDPELKLPTLEAEQSSVAHDLLDASTCVVSIDYLTRPVEVLTRLRKLTKLGGSVHLVISNRCFPTKVVGRWLKVDEGARLDMVGDYLWWSGWREIEILVLVEGSWINDPLWVVRGVNS